MNTLITLDKVDVTLQERQILSQISLTLERGKLITLIGPNGAGKSTLVKLVLGLIQPSTGSVIRAPNLVVGYVPQTLNIDVTLPMTVERFLHLVPTKHRSNIDATLASLGSVHLKQHSMHHLSGGELQRVLLTRALLAQPDLLVLDEPVQGVDINGQVQLYELIQTLAETLNCTVLMVSHDLHLVMARTDHVICLNHHICCQGKPQSVSAHPEFARLFGESEQYQLAVYKHDHLCDPKDKSNV